MTLISLDFHGKQKRESRIQMSRLREAKFIFALLLLLIQKQQLTGEQLCFPLKLLASLLLKLPLGFLNAFLHCSAWHFCVQLGIMQWNHLIAWAWPTFFDLWRKITQLKQQTCPPAAYMRNPRPIWRPLLIPLTIIIILLAKRMNNLT